MIDAADTPHEYNENYHCLLAQVLIISLLAQLRSQESRSVLPEMQKKMSESNYSRVD